MRLDILAAVLSREFGELLRNRLLVLSLIAPPVALTAAPLFLTAVIKEEPLPAGLARQLIELRPEWAGLAAGELSVAYTAQQFLLIFLIMPAFIPLAISTTSIVTEKTTRSLEAVLATPIRTVELLAGKALAALVPGVAVGWATYAVFLGLMTALHGPRLAAIVGDATWLAGVFLLGPAVGLLAVVAGVVVSSRVNDARTAQQVGGIIIVPLIGASVAQATGTVLIGAQGYAIGAVVVAAVAVLGLRLGVALFGRESILTRWR